MTRLLPLVVAVALGGLGSADEPRREKAPPEPVRGFEQTARLSAARAAQDLAHLHQAEAVLKLAEAQRARTDALFAQGVVTAADRDATRAAEDLARMGVVQLRRLADQSAQQSRTDGERFAFATRGKGADITGILAVEVVFPDADRPKVAAAARGLIDAATFVTDGTAEAWEAAQKQPHVHVRFPTPHRAVRAKDVREIDLAEAVVPLPLTRDPGGVVLVRSGARVVRFAKYPHDACVRFQEALAAAVPLPR